MARRAEKDNRIGQFFTPPTAVAATCRLAGIRPTDTVLDPACGTARFLIHAMDLMVRRAGEVAGVSKAIAESRIRTRQLLGCDLDPWVSIIGKMNMYIHGDGKSNVREGNGLTLAARAAFAPQIQGPLVDMVDMVPTNPPLGDIDFAAVAKDVGVLLAGPGATPAEAEEQARLWSSRAFEVVPHKIKEQADRDRAAAKVAEYAGKVAVFRAAGETAKAARALATMGEWQQKVNAASAAIGAGTVTYVPAGRTAKGGVLFISALVKVLKAVRDSGMPAEWQGGVLSLVIDEAVLNTREYADARKFIRHHYFIKAVVSLPRDAFEDLARTTAKTSILFLVKKGDAAIRQREPVFFAHAERIGPSGSDLLKPNDLDAVCGAYDAWRDVILGGCSADGTPVPEPFRIDEARAAASAVLAPLGDFAGFAGWDLDPAQQRERLDVAYWRMKAAVAALPSTVPLSDLATLVRTGRTPAAADFYTFAFVSRLTAIVASKGVTDTSYSPEDLQEVRAGDVLVSGIDLVNGSIGVVGPECDGMVVSKEYLILQAKDGVDAHWLVAMLRTSPVRRIIEGTVTGTSNRTRVESPDALMALRVPPALPADAQRAAGDRLRAAHDHQRAAGQAIREAEAMALPA